jgi:hypothetical protein
MGTPPAFTPTLPPAVLQHVVTKTDGVPLFVEELTKTVLESGLLRETEERYELTGPFRYEPSPPVAAAGQTSGGPPTAGGELRLGHRGL